MASGLRRRDGRPDEGGASAVEFAIILPILMVLIFGIIDYGFFFFDSIGMRQGAREAARQGVVLRVDSARCGSPSAASIACTARYSSNNVIGNTAGSVNGGGPSQVKVKAYIQQSAPNPDNTWRQGNQLVVCTQVAERAITGLVPFPSGGIMRSKTVMSIEKESTVLTGFPLTDSPPTGGDWAWCTA